jgi:AcrR family transcriptional regulator
MSNTDRTRRKVIRRGTVEDVKNPSTSRRRTQAERSETTRKLVLDATIRILVRKGAAGLRTGEVVKEAGVSVGAQLHHFPTKRALILAAFDYVNERSVEMCRQRVKLARRAGNTEAVINAIIADGTEFFFGNGFFIELALAFGQADLDLRRVVRRSSRRSRFLIEAIWREMLEKQGLPSEIAGDILALTLSMVRGFAMRRFIEDDPARRTHLVKVWRDMIRAYLGSRLDEKQFAGIFVEPVIADRPAAAAATAPTTAWLPLKGASEKSRPRKRARKRV